MLAIALVCGAEVIKYYVIVFITMYLEFPFL